MRRFCLTALKKFDLPVLTVDGGGIEAQRAKRAGTTLRPVLDDRLCELVTGTATFWLKMLDTRITPVVALPAIHVSQRKP